MSQKSVGVSTQPTLEFYLSDYPEKYSTVAVGNSNDILHLIYLFYQISSFLMKENLWKISVTFQSLKIPKAWNAIHGIFANLLDAN